MTVLALLDHLRRAGVVLGRRGDRLLCDAPAGVLTPAILADLKARKAEMLAVLAGDWCAAASGLLAQVDAQAGDALRYLFDERAGIVEIDGNEPRAEAERVAYAELAQVVDGATDAAEVTQTENKGKVTA